MLKRELRIFWGAVFFIVGIVVGKFYMPTLEIPILLIGYCIVGSAVLFKAYKNILKGDFFDENFLMSVATIGAILVKEIPEAVSVMLFYEIGELFQSYAVAKSRKSISDLMDIKPEYANVIRDNKTLKVEPDEVYLDEIIEIRPGEKIPLDAIVIKGESTVDTSALTGEAIPIEVRENSRILSACININGLLLARVTKEYYDSTVMKILDLVENSATKKSKSERLITKFSKIYTPIVVFLAILLAIIPPFILNYGEFQTWLFRAFTFLVVSCPCAFVISVPMSFFGGVGAASKAGVLVKGGNYLENLAKMDTVVFDKTGTLTKGVFNVQKVVSVNSNLNENEILEYVALAEAGSNHPIAKSIIKYYGKEIKKDFISNLKEISGKGIEATIKNKKVVVGNEKLIKLPKDFSVNEFGTLLYVEIDGEFSGYILIADEIKRDVKTAIENLKKTGIDKAIMLTGDIQKVANKVGEELNIDKIYAELLPNDKVKILEEIIEENKNSKNKIAFVGDGINDAPVLARADVGIAMGGIGSDAAIEAADVVLMTDEISKLVTAIFIARKTLKIANQNIALALGVKVLFLFLSVFGLTSMWGAVFADVGVTIIAILNSLRTLKIDKRD
ncbi:MAG: cadmium-translocating P-type ATPase [Fusobacteriales bacterium]|nr:MAG: cadmium-translocating P-type ATPase [Fusobacteriales bacterium]